jgi:hypothetical protein
MSTSITKLAPQAIVLAVMLYWSWPVLKTFTPQAPTAAPKVDPKKPAAPQGFAGDVLSPRFLPPSKRNPFLPLYSKSTTLAGPAKRGQKNTIAKTAAEVRDSGLVLNATCIVGQQRMAIINGRVYKEKEAIERRGDEAGSCVVTDILPHKVLLSYQGQTLQLSYADAAAKPAAGNNPRKPTK